MEFRNFLTNPELKSFNLWQNAQSYGKLFKKSQKQLKLSCQALGVNSGLAQGDFKKPNPNFACSQAHGKHVWVMSMYLGHLVFPGWDWCCPYSTCQGTPAGHGAVQLPECPPPTASKLNVLRPSSPPPQAAQKTMTPAVTFVPGSAHFLSLHSMDFFKKHTGEINS